MTSSGTLGQSRLCTKPHSAPPTLTSLKAEWRSVVLMIGVGGLSYEDAAAALHIPVGTVRSRYSRTRTQLIANLADTAGHKGTGDKVS